MPLWIGPVWTCANPACLFVNAGIRYRCRNCGLPDPATLERPMIKPRKALNYEEIEVARLAIQLHNARPVMTVEQAVDVALAFLETARSKIRERGLDDNELDLDKE